jgi:hypothetical protein
MKKLQVFDPPMCCTSGVCGTTVDTKLVKFANDLEWLKKEGIDVERHGLAFEPAAFVNNELVKNTLEKEGNDCLPLVIANNEILCKGTYPSREKLAEVFDLVFKPEDAAQEAVISEDSNSCCGPECDCHKSAVSDSSKKAIFIIILLIIAGIIAVKSCCKAGAVETKKNTVAGTKSETNQFGEYLESLNQLKLSKDVDFVFIPSKESPGITASAKSAVISTQNILKGKNIKVNLYTLKTTSPDYASIVAQAKPPAFMVVNQGQGKSFVTGDINKTRLLQAYIAATRDCGSSCPCHK